MVDFPPTKVTIGEPKQLESKTAAGVDGIEAQVVKGHDNAVVAPFISPPVTACQDSTDNVSGHQEIEVDMSDGRLFQHPPQESVVPKSDLSGSTAASMSSKPLSPIAPMASPSISTVPSGASNHTSCFFHLYTTIQQFDKVCIFCVL